VRSIGKWYPTPRIISPPVAAGAGAFELNAEPLSYSIALASATLESARMLNAEALAYTIALNDAALVSGYALNAEPLTYALSLTAAELITSAVETPVPETPEAGAKRRRRERRRWVLDVEGKDVIFQSLEALLAFLAAREPALGAVAEAKAERDALRVLRVGPAQARAAPPPFLLASEHDEVREALSMLERAVARRYRSTLAVALSRDAEEIDDILFIARILDD